MGDSMDVVRIFDTTLRDGEQSPGFSMNTEEKIRLARQLASLNVDVIEAGFPIASRGDLEAVQHVGEVEFSAEDAGRTDIDFLCQVCRVAVDAGATVLNLPDTVGYAVPEEYGAMFSKVRAYLGDPQGITLSAHCHDDLGMAVANS